MLLVEKAGSYSEFTEAAHEVLSDKLYAKMEELGVIDEIESMRTIKESFIAINEKCKCQKDDVDEDEHEDDESEEKDDADEVDEDNHENGEDDESDDSDDADETDETDDEEDDTKSQVKEKKLKK